MSVVMYTIEKGQNEGGEVGMESMITYEKHEKSYGIIRLNRPEKRNAISLQMAELLKSNLQEAEMDDIKFLVITGTDDRMFSAGGDLHDLHANLSTEEAFDRLYPMMDVLNRIVQFPVPVIAKLNGDALGGGCELATACDIRIAKEHTKFGFIQTKIGILPGWGGGVLLCKKVQPSFALDWIARGTVFSAEELQEKGWIHRIVPEADWMDDDLFDDYTEKSVEQMRLLKAQFKVHIGADGLFDVMIEDVRAAANLWESDAHREALAKFSKRKSGM